MSNSITWEVGELDNTSDDENAETITKHLNLENTDYSIGIERNTNNKITAVELVVPVHKVAVKTVVATTGAGKPLTTAELYNVYQFYGHYKNEIVYKSSAAKIIDHIKNNNMKIAYVPPKFYDEVKNNLPKIEIKKGEVPHKNYFQAAPSFKPLSIKRDVWNATKLGGISATLALLISTAKIQSSNLKEEEKDKMYLQLPAELAKVGLISATSGFVLMQASRTHFFTTNKTFNAFANVAAWPLDKAGIKNYSVGSGLTNIYHTTNTAQIMKISSLTFMIQYGLISAMDVYDCYAGNISEKQLKINFHSNGAELAGGTTGWLVGAGATATGLAALKASATALGATTIASALATPFVIPALAIVAGFGLAYVVGHFAQGKYNQHRINSNITTDADDMIKILHEKLPIFLEKLYNQGVIDSNSLETLKTQILKKINDSQTLTNMYKAVNKETFIEEHIVNASLVNIFKNNKNTPPYVQNLLNKKNFQIIKQIEENPFQWDNSLGEYVPKEHDDNELPALNLNTITR
jgi:hypothetical protein